MDASISILAMHAAYIDLRRRVVVYKVVHLPELVLEAVRVIGLLDVVVACIRVQLQHSQAHSNCIGLQLKQCIWLKLTGNSTFWKSNRMRSPILFLCVQRFTPL